MGHERGLAVFRAMYFQGLAALPAFVAYLEVQRIHWPLAEASAMPLLVAVLSTMSGTAFVVSVSSMAYGLRWDAPSETAYPATFVIDRSGTVRFAQISRVHGGRTPAADVLAALVALPK